MQIQIENENENESEIHTTIRINKATVRRLKDHGKFQETWDQMLNRLLNDIEGVKPGQYLRTEE